MTKVAPEQLTVAEIEDLIEYKKSLLAAQQEVVAAAEKPYKDACDWLEAAKQEQLTTGAALDAHRKEAARTEETLRKLEQLKHATRGGLLFSPATGQEPKKVWEFRWVDAAVAVLQKEQHFLDADTLMNLILEQYPGYQATLDRLSSKASVINRAIANIKSAAAREGNTTGRGRHKQLALWEGRIGLQKWMTSNGRPDYKHSLTNLEYQEF